MRSLPLSFSRQPPWSGCLWPLRPLPQFPPCDTSTVLQREQQQYLVQHKTRLITFVTFFILVSASFLLLMCTSTRLSIEKDEDIITAAALSIRKIFLIPCAFPRWDTSAVLPTPEYIASSSICTTKTRLVTFATCTFWRVNYSFLYSVRLVEYWKSYHTLLLH